MKPAAFDYVRPKTLAEAVAALRQPDKTAAVLAGGQSLVVLLSLRVASVDILVDVGRLAELHATAETSAGVLLGAATTHAAIEDGEAPDPSLGLMRRVAGTIAYRAVRNHGTVGGSVALADPAADWPPCLMALRAIAQINGPNGTRSETVADLVRGPYETTLAPGEIIVGFDIPRLAARSRWGFAKVTRKSGAFASSIAVVVERADGAADAVLGGLSARARYLPAVASRLQGTPDEAELRSAIAADLTAVEPDADAYQRRLHTATVLRAIREARVS